MPLSALESIALELKEKIFANLLSDRGTYILIRNYRSQNTVKQFLTLARVSKTLRSDVIEFLASYKQTVILNLKFAGRPYDLPSPGMPYMHTSLVKRINLDATRMGFLAYPVDLSKSTFPNLQKLSLIWDNTGAMVGRDQVESDNNAKEAARQLLKWLFTAPVFHPTLVWLKQAIDDGERSFGVYHKVPVTMMQDMCGLRYCVGMVRYLFESTAWGRDDIVLGNIANWPGKVVSAEELAAILHTNE